MRVPGSRAQGWGSLWSESESPTHPPGPALTIHAGEGQRLRPELLLHGDLQVELDVIHACDDFLHGGGGGLGPSSPLRSLRRSSHFTLLLPVPFSIAAAAAAAAPRGMPGVPEPAPAFFFFPHPDSANGAQSPATPSGLASRRPIACFFPFCILQNVWRRRKCACAGSPSRVLSVAT